MGELVSFVEDTSTGIDTDDFAAWDECSEIDGNGARATANVEDRRVRLDAAGAKKVGLGLDA